VSNAQRAGIVVVAAIVAVAAFLILRPDDEDSSEPASSNAPATTVTTPTRTGPTETTSVAEPEVTTIRVRDGKAVGGVKEIEADKGDTVRFEVSTDAPHEVHLHGYDVARDAAPGEPARFEVEAKIEGIFEIELEDLKEQIAELKVSP
jgi:plastocyanin